MKAVYSGSFDPPTIGHIDIIRRSAPMFERLVVCIGINPKKSSLFSVAERLDLLKQATSDLPNVDVDSSAGLLVDYCRSIKANVIVRGLRTSADFEYESQMALANRALAPEIETIFLLADPGKAFISSSAVKEMALFGRDVSQFVPDCVATAMKSAVFTQGIN